MAAAISGFSPTTPPASAKGNTLGTMTGGDFLNLMIKQLQQQDPLNPTDSNQLLTQMSQISTLQSNQGMVDNISALTLQQSIGAGANLIGKTINGIDDNGDSQQGIVTSIKVENKKVRLMLDGGSELPMANVLQINGTSATAAGALTNTLPQLQQLLNASGGGTADGSSKLANLSQLLSTLGLTLPQLQQQLQNSTPGNTGSASNPANLSQFLSTLGLN